MPWPFSAKGKKQTALAVYPIMVLRQADPFDVQKVIEDLKGVATEIWRRWPGQEATVATLDGHTDQAKTAEKLASMINGKTPKRWPAYETYSLENFRAQVVSSCRAGQPLVLVATRNLIRQIQSHAHTRQTSGLVSTFLLYVEGEITPHLEQVE